MSFLFLFSYLVIGSCPFSSVSVSSCLLEWVLLSPFRSFFSCFLIYFVLSFSSSLLASHCWESLLSVSLMYFKSFFKFSLSSFVEEVTLSSLVFVSPLSFCWLFSAALFCSSLEPSFTLFSSSLLALLYISVVHPWYIFISAKDIFASSAVL